MKNKIIALIVSVLLLSILLAACQSAPKTAEDKDILFQYSTLGSLLEGVFDGEMTLAEIKQQGDFGLGTFNKLDGEMIEIDHQVYQVKSDGVAYKVSDETKTPFAVVTYFDTDQTVKITESMDCTQLKEYIDSLLPTKNIPYAIRIDGTFSTMKTRSEAKQSQPYQPLMDVLKNQVIFEFNETEGSIVGFRLPDYMDVANATGYHFHFITTDRTAGGHVLDCQTKDVTVEIDYTDQWHTVLPADDAFYKVEMGGDEYK
jgi:acetolactate decarboxylase